MLERFDSRVEGLHLSFVGTLCNHDLLVLHYLVFPDARIHNHPYKPLTINTRSKQELASYLSKKVNFLNLWFITKNTHYVLLEYLPQNFEILNFLSQNQKSYLFE